MKKLILAALSVLAGGLVLSTTAQAANVSAMISNYAKTAKAIEAQILILKKGACESGMAQNVAARMDDSLAGIHQQQKDVLAAIKKKERSVIDQYIAKSDSDNREMNSNLSMVLGGLSDPDNACVEAQRAFRALRDYSLNLNAHLRSIAGAL